RLLLTPPPPCSPPLPYTTLFRSLRVDLGGGPGAPPKLVRHRAGPDDAGEGHDQAGAAGAGDDHHPALPATGGGQGVAEGLQALRSEEHTSELQSREKLVCRLLLE